MLEHHSAQIADRRKSMLQLYASALFLFFMLHVAQKRGEGGGCYFALSALWTGLGGG
jgi:hypothetical protein